MGFREKKRCTARSLGEAVLCGSQKDNALRYEPSPTEMLRYELHGVVRKNLRGCAENGKSACTEQSESSGGATLAQHLGDHVSFEEVLSNLVLPPLANDTKLFTSSSHSIIQSGSERPHTSNATTLDVH